MPELLIRISPNGDVTHLHTDALSLKRLGPKEVHRATDVFFENATQSWRIRNLATGAVWPRHFESRKEAIKFEVDVLQSRLFEGYDVLAGLDRQSQGLS